MVTSILDKYGVKYRRLTQTRPTVSIEDTAAARGIEPHTMLKCVLLRDMDEQLYLVCTRGTDKVVPPVIRPHLNCRRMTSVAYSDVELRCGHTPGTLNPLSLDTSILRVFNHQIGPDEQVTISSGDPLLGLALRFGDLIELCDKLQLNTKHLATH